MRFNVGRLGSLNAAVKANEFRMLDEMPEKTLKRILEVAADSEYLGDTHKALLG